MAKLPSLALQIKNHLKTGPHTVFQLAAMTGEKPYTIIDNLTLLMAHHEITQDFSPRYRLLDPGRSVADTLTSFPPGDAATLSALGRGDA